MRGEALHLLKCPAMYSKIFTVSALLHIGHIILSVGGKNISSLL